MSTGVISWSQTAANNAIADSTVNWAEGQSPSTVNDSARAMMASIAKWRDDIAGAIVTSGTSTAYTLRSNQTFTSLAQFDGKIIAFTPHVTNGGACTINVDTLGAKPLRPSPSVEFAAGDLVAGTPYVGLFNNSNGEVYVLGAGAMPTYVPLGAMLPYTGSTAPNSRFVFPYGQEISRTTYASYFGLVSTTYGTGNGTTTFNVPDLRGRIPIGLDTMGGSAASRITTAGSGIDGTTIGASGGEQSHVLTTSEMPVHNHGITDPGHSHTVNANDVGVTGGPSQLPIVQSASGNANQAGAAATTTTGITINNAGSGTAHNNVPPAIIMPFILRIL